MVNYAWIGRSRVDGSVAYDLEIAVGEELLGFLNGCKKAYVLPRRTTVTVSNRPGQAETLYDITHPPLTVHATLALPHTNRLVTYTLDAFHFPPPSSPLPYPAIKAHYSVTVLTALRKFFHLEPLAQTLLLPFKFISAAVFTPAGDENHRVLRTPRGTPRDFGHLDRPITRIIPSGMKGSDGGNDGREMKAKF
eukprot:TRINITY_DN35541_c0_g1_i1.p1 TRINITY_DN35541_c0_g1~~TRINITY_DN35541_c0_g1_i1.p1  ORF type:complete len:208 (+),score=16.20 TRINITY_DN35541_c0_g1_i1:46-624(+)